jgi:hypothetical protein
MLIPPSLSSIGKSVILGGIRFGMIPYAKTGNLMYCPRFLAIRDARVAIIPYEMMVALPTL